MKGKLKPVVKVDKITGEILAEYKSISQAARCNIPISYYTIAGMCQRKSLGYQSFVFRYASDYNPNESYENRLVNVPIELFYKGRYRYVSNIADAAITVRCTRESISHAITDGNTIYGVRVRRLRFMGDICQNREKVILEGEL